MKSTHVFRSFSLLALIALWGGAAPAGAQSLGAAATSAVQASAGVTAAGGVGTTINGDVGSSPTASITGFPPAVVVAPFSIHVNDGFAVAAQAAVNSLFVSLGSGACTTSPTAQMAGTTFTPGTHCFGAAADLSAGSTVTLDGAGTYIFRVASALTANVGSNLILTGGADACNVFWQVGSSATLNGVNFSGNVVAQASVTVGVSATLIGRALARTAAVSLAGNNTVGGCSVAPPPPPPVCPAITLSPTTLPNGAVAVAYNQTVSASGGVAPHTFTLTSGSLPGGLSLSPSGVIAGTPGTAGTFTFTVQGTDANGCFGTRNYTIIIVAAPPPPGCPVIVLAPLTLPNGAVAAPYNQTLSASGGVAPITFSLTSGSLPGGLTLSPAGVIAGTPATAGTFTFTVRGADANGCFGNQSYTIVIAAAPPPPGCPVIALAPSTLPNGTVAMAYSQTISASGGVAPITFSITSGSLPGGLTLSPGGEISGTATTAGTFTFNVRAADANGCFGNQSYTIIIAAAPPPPPVCPAITLAPATLPNGTVAVAYNQIITASGGTAPVTFGVISGSLPGGLTLSPVGVLSGTAASAGTFTFTVRGTDANGCFGDLSYTIIIAAAPPPPPICPSITLAPPTLPAGMVAVAYHETLSASGGTAPYSFGIASGTPPGGLNLSPAGLLSGTPTVAGLAGFTIRATDANGCFADLPFILLIAIAPPPPPGCPVVTLAPATLPNGMVAVAYSQALVASGGAAPYSFGIIAGGLPAGLSLSPMGVLAGTPAAGGSTSFTVRATDANGCFADRPYLLLTVAAPPPPPGCPILTVTPASLPAAAIGVAYSQTIVATGGTAPYGFGLIAGALPAGIRLSATGVLSGMPTVGGTSSFTVRVTDAAGCFRDIPYSVITPIITPVPTFSEWAMIGLILMLALAGHLSLARRNTVSS